jgi:hypothetical protein
MVYDLSAGPPLVRATECTIKRLTQPLEVEAYCRVAEAALDKNYSVTRGELLSALAQDSTQHLGYIAYVGSEPASIGRLYTHPLSHFGGLYGGATLDKWRKLGLYRAIVAARAADAIRLGAIYLLVDALPTSQPILEQLGFEHLTDTIPFERP